MNSVGSFLERMGSNFLVAGMIPALAFISSVMFAFEPILPPGISNRLGGTFNPLGQSGLLALIIAIILGFTLTSLNTFILKVFEGYILFWRIPFFRQVETRRFKSYQRRLARLKKNITQLSEQKNKDARNNLKLDQLLDQERELVTEFQYQFSPYIHDVMPFPFGNILRASETYPVTRYKIDSVPMWTRLIQVIPAEYSAKIDQTHNQLSFLVNCAVLSVLFALASLCAGFYQVLVSAWVYSGGRTFLYFLPLDLSYDIYFQRSLVYFMGMIAAFFMAVIFNRASMLSVAEFGEMIRSSYDLFRFDLLQQLHIDLPKDSTKELDVWTRISHFVGVGYYFGKERKLKPIIYNHNEPVQDSDQPKPLVVKLQFDDKQPEGQSDVHQ